MTTLNGGLEASPRLQSLSIAPLGLLTAHHFHYLEGQDSNQAVVLGQPRAAGWGKFRPPVQRVERPDQCSGPCFLENAHRAETC